VLGEAVVGWVIEVVEVVALDGLGMTEAKMTLGPGVGVRFPVANLLHFLNSIHGEGYSGL
jgi:hypothetical protein